MENKFEIRDNVMYYAGTNTPVDLTPSLTAEQQGSDESGEGLTEAERKSLRRDILNRYNLRGIQTNETGLSATTEAAIDVFEAALATARREVEEMRQDLLDCRDVSNQRAAMILVQRADLRDLRARLGAVEALADDIGCIRGSIWRDDVATRIRAALANPSAAQGEGDG